MWRLKTRRRESSRDDSVVEFTIPGKGALVMDGDEVVKLRLAAAEVGGSSLGLIDRDGDLVIALSVPVMDPQDTARARREFCRLAGLCDE